MKEDKHIPVKVSVFERISKKMKPIKNKVGSLIEGHYNSSSVFPERDLTVLLELQVSCTILCNFLDELKEQATEASTDELQLLPEEVTLLTTLVTAVESASTHGLGNTNLMDH